MTGTTVALAVLVAAVGCAGSSSSPHVASSSAAASRAAHEDCPPVHGQGYASVDYVDFVQMFGQQYVAGLTGKPIVVRSSELSRVVLRSRCSLSALNDRTHKAPGPARDGDTAFLKPGTPIYAVRGWSTHCRLAARSAAVGQLVAYLALQRDARRATPRACALRR